MEKFYSPKEIAKIIGVNEITIRRWCRNGELPYTKFGKFMRVEAKDFEAYCKRNRVYI